MEFITRTIYGAALQTATLLGKTPKINPLSTLNTKFGVMADVLPGVADIPVMGYMAIGIGGHYYSVGSNNIPKPEPIQHRSRDAACYTHLPFVLREITNDLTAAERANYAIRRPETHNGLQYYAYYLKRYDLTNAELDLEYVTVDGDTETPAPFEPNSGDLNPVPPDISSTGVNVVSGDYLQATSKLDLSLSEWDADELKNVATVLYGDPGYAIISEIALCSAINKDTTVPGPGNTNIPFTEAIGVQVVAHVNAFYSMNFSPNGVEILVDAGASEPLFVLKKQ